MKKRILSLALVVVMVALVAAGSMAYFTDTAAKDNVMTFGKVDITLNDVYDENAKLVPAVFEYTTGDNGETKITVQNKVSKTVSVTNDGTSDAYVRVIYAFEGTSAEVQDYINVFVNEQNWDYNPVYNATNNKFYDNNPDDADGSPYTADTLWGARTIKTENGYWTIAEAVYAGPLASGATTEENLTGFFLAPTADYDHTDDNVKNGVDTLFGTEYEIQVLVQAVQVDGFKATDTKSAARVGLETAFGNLWNGEVTDQMLADWFNLGTIQA